MRHILRPLFDRVVVKELEPDRIRQSGLLVPPGSHEPPPQHGIVLAVGPGLDWWEGAGISMPVKPGDHVNVKGTKATATVGGAVIGGGSNYTATRIAVETPAPAAPTS